MAGSRGKGSRAKPKNLAPEPAAHDPLKTSFDKSADGLLDGEDGKTDISNRKVIPLEEVQTDELISEFIVSEEPEEEDQIAHEVNDREKDLVTETDGDKYVTMQEETTEDENEVSGGNDGSSDENVEENGESTSEKESEDGEASEEFGLENDDGGTAVERKSSEVITESLPTNNEGLASSDHGTTENMTDKLENHEEPSKLDVEEPEGVFSDRGEEERSKENASIINEANVPKKKVVKKKVVVKKMVRKRAAAITEENPLVVDENNASGEAGKVDTDEHANNADTSGEACNVDKNEPVGNDEKAEDKPPVKVNKKRSKKKAPPGNLGKSIADEVQDPQSGNGELEIKKHIETNESDVKNEEAEKSGNGVSPSKRSGKKKLAKKGPQVGVKDANNSKLSKDGTSSKRIDSMGMIFMCSSETKKDCYRYKILGQPAGKKDVVMKIYKGMRLFLFDVDLRMMYGIYKAAGPGGYNIEPRAFKSQFPSQVRFTVLEDCVPLAEERFKKVLKDNYYSKNKFNFQLNSEQVKNLCKLFHETSKKADSKVERGNRRAPVTPNSSRKESGPRRAPVTPSSSARRDKKRKRVEDRRRGPNAPVERERSRRRTREEPRRAPVAIDDRNRRRAQEETRYAPVLIDDRTWRRAQEEPRHAPLVIDDRNLRRAQEVVIDDRYHGLPVYEREAYLPSVAPVTLYQPLPALSPPRTSAYAYERPLGVEPYRRDSIIDPRDLALTSSRDSRLPIERAHQDPYVSYREPVYSAPVYSTETRRESQVYSAPVYSTDARREHYDYTSDGRFAEYYRATEARPPPPLYRRY